MELCEIDDFSSGGMEWSDKLWSAVVLIGHQAPTTRDVRIPTAVSVYELECACGMGARSLLLDAEQLKLEQVSLTVIDYA